MQEAFIIDAGTPDLTRQVIGEDGHVCVLPASFYDGTTTAERMRLCVAHGLYCLPTEELVGHLRGLIAGHSALEIGAGNGVLARALGIRATDSRMQELPQFQEHYRKLGQATVRYGKDVEKRDAVEAVDHYRPEVVVAAWVTHRYDPTRPEAGGNQYGIDEESIIDRCERYVLIGNEHVHRGKSIWSRPHDIIYPSWLKSRAVNGTRDFVAIWDRARSRSDAARSASR